MFGGRQADVHVDAERLGDLCAEVLAECAAGDPAGDFAEDEAEGDHVIALRGAGLPPRFGRGNVSTDRVPVKGFRGREPGAGSDDSGAMAHHHSDGDVVLSGLAELGPVLGDGGVKVEFAAIGQQVNAGAGQRF